MSNPNFDVRIYNNKYGTHLSLTNDGRQWLTIKIEDKSNFEQIQKSINDYLFYGIEKHPTQKT